MFFYVETFCILIQMSYTFVSKNPIDNTSASV